jgi:hypothetical protein
MAFGAGDQRVQRRGGDAGLVVAGEQPVLAADGDALQGALGWGVTKGTSLNAMNLSVSPRRSGPYGCWRVKGSPAMMLLMFGQLHHKETKDGHHYHLCVGAGQG